jgi:hypothetical protein
VFYYMPIKKEEGRRKKEEGFIYIYGDSDPT